MISLPGVEETITVLKNGPLRDFGQPSETPGAQGPSFRRKLTPTEVPVPALWRVALELVDLEPRGPGEKIAWSIEFTFGTTPCALTHEKFGARLYVIADDADQAETVSNQIIKKIRSAVKSVEKLIKKEAPNLLGQGHATVVNQHLQLHHAYEYFREKALAPNVIESVTTEHLSADGTVHGWSTTNGPAQMRVNAFHDLVASITAYLSLREHDLVLALAFQGFDPQTDNVTEMIASSWADKYERVLGTKDPAPTYRARLYEIVERWRNTYAHGGFGKERIGTSAGAVYLHVPGVGALPVGLTNVSTSPLFTLFPATPTDIEDVFTFFDEFDAWLRTTMPGAMAWVESGLDVRFDQKFRDEAAAAIAAGTLDEYMHGVAEEIDRFENMDF